MLSALLTYFIIFIIIFYAWDYVTYKGCPPGPFKIPLLGNAHLIGEVSMMHDFNRLAKKYGDKGVLGLQMGSNYAVLLSSKEAVKEALLTKGGEFQNRWQIPSLNSYSKGWTAPAWANGKYWRKVRKLTLGAMNNCWDELFLNLDEEYYKMMGKLRICAESGQLINVDHMLRLFNYNMLYRITTGKKSLKKFEDSKFCQLTNELVQITSHGNPRDMLTFLRYMPYTDREKHRDEVVRQRDEEVRRLVDEFKRNKDKTTDGGMLRYFLKNGDETVDVVSLITDIVVGGTDTSTILEEWAIYFLMNSPGKLKKAQDEVDAIIGRNRLADLSDLDNLPYITSIYYETLRMRIPAPLGVPHYVYDEQTVQGYRIPANTIIFINQHGLAMDPNLWKNPEEFRPERWMEEESHITMIGPTGGETDDNVKFISLGLGRRCCGGYRMAFLSPILVIARLIQQFEFETVDGQPPKLDVYAIPLQQPRYRTKLRVKVRK